MVFRDEESRERKSRGENISDTSEARKRGKGQCFSLSVSQNRGTVEERQPQKQRAVRS